MQFLVDSPSHPPSSPRHHPYQHHAHYSPTTAYSHVPSSQPTPPQPQTHHIPFSQPPGAAPGSLGFGFGLSAASSLNVQSSWGGAAGSTGGWGKAPSWGSRTGSGPAAGGFGQQATATTPQQQQQQQQAPSSPLASNSPASAMGRRRRRSLSPGEEEVEMEEREQARREVRGIKKARVGGAGGAGGSLQPEQAGQDLGKALAGLSKPSLLTLLNTLVTQNPHLKPTIAALLPPPTLSSTLASLATLERAVLAALPAGAQLREEYVWGRVRVPLEEYVAEAKSWMSGFMNPSSSSSFASTTGGAAGGGEEDITHPSTTFAFLHALTSSLRRLEVALPPVRPAPLGAPIISSTAGSNPIANHLLPLTLNSWHIFLTRLSTAVNLEGRVMSAGMLRGWFEKLDEICVESPGVGVGVGGVHRGEGMARRGVEGVRERMRKEVGWLVGMRPGAERERSVQAMEEEEEEL